MKASHARLVTRFGREKRFWRLRRTVKRTRFRLLSLIWRLRFRFSETSAGAGALRSLLRDTTVGTLAAGIVLVALGLTDTFGRDVANFAGLKPLHGSAYDTLLQTVASTTGVFLALYFTAVGAIAATVYAAVPHDIRSLIVRDRLGNTYVWGVAFTMALAVLMLIAHAGNRSAYELGLPIIGVGALFSIFAFIRLGQRAFYLADPTLMAGELGFQFLRWFDRAKHGGWRADEAAVQNHYRRQAKRAVDALVSLRRLASGQPHLHGQSSRQLTTRISKLLARYLSERHRVPTQSRWYGERYVHPQWYLTGYTNVQIAGATGSLPPRTVPDVAWVESDLLRPLMNSVIADLKVADYDSAFSGLDAMTRVWLALGAVWSSELGTRWITELTQAILAAVAETANIEVERPELIPGALDVLGLAPLSLELGFHRSIVDRDVATLGDRIAASDWEAPDAAYAFSLPRPVVHTLEQIHDGLKFERADDGPAETMTPGWWVREMAMHSLEWAFHDEIEILVELLGSWYPGTADTLTGAGFHQAAAAVLARGEEAVRKLDAHMYSWEEIAGRIRGEPLLDLKRPTWDWSALQERTDQLHRDLDERLAKSIVYLAEVPENDDVPDFLGHAVHRTGEACFDALANGNDELFVTLFPPYFVGILTVTERLRQRVTRYHPQMAVTSMAGPLLDLLDIAGYALVYSELHRSPAPWESAKQLFDRYFTPPEGIDRMKLVAAMYAHEQAALGLTARSVLRHNWKRALSDQLRSLPRRPGGHEFDHGEVEHESRLIRRIAPDPGLISSLHVDAGDIFVVRYLENMPVANGLDFGVTGWVARELRQLDTDGEGS